MSALQLTEKRARIIVEKLLQHYPYAETTLTHESPWELLVGAILASQCTDERVNKITPALFSEYPDPESMALAEIKAVEPIIRSCGLFRSKAKALVGTAQQLVEHYDGRVPESEEALMALPGVGRKIANLIRGDAFGKQAVVVDTHCARISRLIGFTDSDKPPKIERDLMAILPEEHWTLWGHLMVTHGRDLCKARCRLCFSCPIRAECRYGEALDPSEAEEQDCV
ncbi:MAG: endonuclease III [Clostridiales bacterium]|nr:endonuclease III [Clostridiales bacterium]NLG30013.1 endonuclease III [Clostridiaceae bacterium]